MLFVSNLLSNSKFETILFVLATRQESWNELEFTTGESSTQSSRCEVHVSTMPDSSV